MDNEKLELAKLAIEEYKALKAELLQRNTTLVQMAAASIAGVIAIIGFITAKTIPLGWGITLGVTIVLLMLVVWKIVDSDARKACERLIEIEEYVNRIVGGDEKNPLSWERRFGMLARNYAARLKETPQLQELGLQIDKSDPTKKLE